MPDQTAPRCRRLTWSVALGLLVPVTVLAGCSVSANGSGSSASGSLSTSSATPSTSAASTSASAPVATETVSVVVTQPAKSPPSSSTSSSASTSTSNSPSPSAISTPPPMLPDLTVQGMTITQDSPTHARVTFDIMNIGTVDVTDPFYVYVCITALCNEKQITLPVRAGGSTEVFVDFNHPSSTTPETVAVAVDSRNDINESNENNNTTSLSDVSLNF